ncbi:hypothetical protein G7Y89_g7435 [Cudoniella acicularis]|uniref:Rhodopsin domain-containing protein n=1 Tax=Cudoniella acicularis TaxID=354080 RepID=A0A8H4RJB2_9HELO|nr:hypothetical protein G7Y89_g7435 [Cudoniella acicularis]
MTFASPGFACIDLEGAVAQDLPHLDAMEDSSSPGISQRGLGVVVTSTVALAFAALAVTLRLITRHKILRFIGPEDWCIIAALIFSVGSTIGMCFQAKDGLGHHFKSLSHDNIVAYSKDFFATVILYNISITLTKVSILLLYIRIFGTTKLRNVCYVMFVIIIMYGAWLLGSSIFCCVPVARFWDRSIPGKCLPPKLLTYLNASMNISTDLTLLILPLPVIHSLLLPRPQKMGLYFIFALGLFVCATSIFRLRVLQKSTYSRDTTWDFGDASIWSAIELNTGITCACLTTLKPLVAQFFPRLMASFDSHDQSNVYPSMSRHRSGNSQSTIGRTRLTGRRSDTSSLHSSRISGGGSDFDFGDLQESEMEYEGSKLFMPESLTLARNHVSPKGSEAPFPTSIVTVAVAIAGGLHLLLHYTQDAKEPPTVSTFLPFFGPMIGLSRKKSKYYVELRDKYDLPIYTLRLPGSRLYVVNAISLIPAVQRQFKTLAFPPLEAKLAMSICGSSKTANEILSTNVNGDEGYWGYSITFYKTIHTPLAPGPELDAMNRVMAQKVAASIDRLEEKVVGLFDFIRHEITLASTDSVYGPKNPFKDPAIEESFWKFPPGIMILIMDFLPSILARESVQAREFMTKAFTRYFKEGGHNQGSGLIRTRYEHSTEHKVPVEDIARFEVGGAIAILVNTSPASFWMAYYLYSDLAVLEDCRQELYNIISDDTVTTEDGEVIRVRTLDLSRVKASCPILLSTMQEVLRVHTVGISTRMVMEDHMLDNKYLLKKGSTVLIPGPVQHTSSSSWGTDVKEFDHRRFLPKEKRHHPVAFPMLILRFDLTPVEGKWVRPSTDKAEIWETIPTPDHDIKVKISPRAGQDRSAKWRILVSDSDKAMPISAEDL